MKLLLVEDDESLRASIAAALEHQGYIVEIAVTAEEAVCFLMSTEFAAIILDLNLPGMSGQELLRSIRSKGSAIPVLITSARDAVSDRIDELNAGADDYLVKPFGVAELLARLAAVVRRHHGAAGNEIRCGRLVLDIQGRQARVANEVLTLSKRELEILEYLLINRGRVISRQSLLARSSYIHEELTLNSVEVAVHRLRSKISGSGVILTTIRGLGYVLDEHTSE